MITITPRAAQQIAVAARQGGTEGMALRIAAKEGADGSIEYGMGFDERKEDDVQLTSEGVEVVIAAAHKPLLGGTTLDYVELEENDFRFIFLNPNDPNYVPPKE
jgi:iron-sulfur cluster assembly protein